MVSTVDVGLLRMLDLARKKIRLLAGEKAKAKENDLDKSIILLHEKFKIIQSSLQLKEKPVTLDAISEIIHAMNKELRSTRFLVSQNLKKHPQLKMFLKQPSIINETAYIAPPLINCCALKSYFRKKNKAYLHQIDYYNEEIRSIKLRMHSNINPYRNKSIDLRLKKTTDEIKGELKNLIKQIDGDISTLRSNINEKTIFIEKINSIIEYHDYICRQRVCNKLLNKPDITSTLDACLGAYLKFIHKKIKLHTDAKKRENFLNESMGSSHQKLKMIHAMHQELSKDERSIKDFISENIEKYPPLKRSLKQLSIRIHSPSIDPSLINCRALKSYFREQIKNKAHQHQIDYNEEVKLIQSNKNLDSINATIDKMRALISQIDRDTSTLENNNNKKSIFIEKIDVIIQRCDDVCTHKDYYRSIKSELIESIQKSKIGADIGKYSQSSVFRSNHNTLIAQCKVNVGQPA